MELTVGAVLDGKVKTITNFGAFVALDDTTTGMVHISEVANTYVSDIRQHLTEGQDVKVMVIGLDGGKINLSMKKAQPQERPAPRAPRPVGTNPAPRTAGGYQPRPAQQNRTFVKPPQPVNPPTAEQSFEDKLKQFLSSSEGKMADLNRSIDGKRGGGRRRR